MANYCEDANCQFAYIYAEGSGTTVDDQSSNNVDGTFVAEDRPAWSSSVERVGMEINTQTLMRLGIMYCVHDWAVFSQALLRVYGDLGFFVTWATH